MQKKKLMLHKIKLSYVIESSYIINCDDIIRSK